MNTIQLIEVGTVAAIPASEVKVGDERLYNYHGTAVVIKIIEKSPKTLTFITCENGKYYMFDIRKSTLVAINQSGLDVSMHTPKKAYNTRKREMVDVTEYFPIVEEVTVIEESQTTEEVTEKVEIESITFEWSESSLIKPNHTVHTMAEAEMLVYRIACSIEENDGYCNKTGFVIKWTDGNTYKGRIDIVVSDKRVTTPLKDHILAHCNFFAGNRPSHLNEEDYQSMLRAYKVTDKEMQEYKEFMNKYLLEDIKKEEVNEQPVTIPEVTEEVPTNQTIDNNLSNNEVTVNHNKERNSVELSFSTKPDEETRSLMKANKFRWGKYNKVWYKQNPTQSDYDMINSLTNNNLTTGNSEVTESLSTPEYPEIDINDIESYTVPQEVQDRDYESGWIFRGDKVDHTKQLQESFTEYNNKVIELLQTTDNKRIEYELKKSLQYFKKHYHESYIKYLSSKGSQPSWAVTGRSGLNINRYNKNMSRIDSHMHKLNELQSGYEKRFNKAKKEISKDEQRKVTEAVGNMDINITFTMKKKEFSYMGVTENRKVHCYQDYWIAKTWGCFRCFKGSQEIHACKSKETLDHAIKYVIYHMNQENQKVG